MGPPRISVLMSVHNGVPWVREAVESVLAQTIADLEFIVIDDGSTDTTPDVLSSIPDRRLRLERQESKGLTRSLNHALGLATARLVARMDADDVALPERFARQLAFLDTHPDVGVLGTACLEITTSGEIVRMLVPPTDDASIRRALIRRNPFIHSSVAMRRTVLETVGGYDETLPVAQDYDLWLRMSRLTRMANLPEPLVLRRLTPGQVSSARDTERIKTEIRVKLRALRSGAYPLWWAVFLAKPVLALALPARFRRLARRVLAGRRAPDVARRSGRTRPS